MPANMQWVGDSTSEGNYNMKKGASESKDESVNLEMGLPIYAEGGARGGRQT